jgi:hypothetical protein
MSETAEGDAALWMAERIPGSSRVTPAGHKGYAATMTSGSSLSKYQRGEAQSVASRRSERCVIDILV